MEELQAQTLAIEIFKAFEDAELNLFFASGKGWGALFLTIIAVVALLVVGRRVVQSNFLPVLVAHYWVRKDQKNSLDKANLPKERTLITPAD